MELERQMEKQRQIEREKEQQRQKMLEQKEVGEKSKNTIKVPRPKFMTGRDVSLI